MATLVEVQPPEPALDVAWQPADGMALHTVLVREARTAMVLIECPASWTPEQVAQALGNRTAQVMAGTRWYESVPSAEVVELFVGEVAPDVPDAKPVTLDASALVAPTPIKITTPSAV